MAKEKKAEQQELPGVEKKIESIHKAGLELAGVRQERMELTKREADLAKQIMESMKGEKLARYAVEGLELEIVAIKERVKVHLDIDKEEDGDQGTEDGD
jgi:hypothetical protein